MVGTPWPVSVIIPVYNAESTLKECVTSALEQSCPPAEILLVDDGSTDGTLSLAAQLAGENPSIRLLRQEHAGVSEARNCGLHNAVGDYVIFLDSDDSLLDGALAALLEGARQADACCGGILRGNEKQNDRPANYRVLSSSDMLDASLADPTNLLTVHGWIFRRDLCPEFNTRLTMGEDSDWVLRFIAGCTNVAVFSKAVYRYTISVTSTVNLWKPGKTAAYLETVETVGKGAVQGKKNWPLFVLTTLLLILTHDTFHPSNPANRKTQFQEARRLRAMPVIDQAFQRADLKKLSFFKRVPLGCMKQNWIWPVWAAVKVRQRQNAAAGADR